MILDQSSAAIGPITIVDVPVWTDQPLLSAMDMSVDKSGGWLSSYGLKQPSSI